MTPQEIDMRVMECVRGIRDTIDVLNQCELNTTQAMSLGALLSCACGIGELYLPNDAIKNAEQTIIDRLVEIGFLEKVPDGE